MGREFVPLFDQWSNNYDLTVTGHNEQYQEVFEDYEKILHSVVSEVHGTILEFGVGTGNLTEKLVAAGHKVYGVEPSRGMIQQIQRRKINFQLFEGDFLDFPPLTEPIDAIVSTYAFHHLTDAEKEQAISIYAKLLQPHGKIVFADTIFQNQDSRRQIEEEVASQGYSGLLTDLRTEYYTTIEVLHPILSKHGFRTNFSRLNKYVWLMSAQKEIG
ncbi:class I SAM-dependent methyltransferase [Paenibacillus sp. DCT19]|uniref:class I SAM-dependent DNA methyltransferase n=1 Tax=Paenibacillus sp. DCT19 TaxID=2211212 RepID=UPI000FE2658C|nr:class I SAM-dependent methyltransferase [Paenibacillus sp. DCT19]